MEHHIEVDAYSVAGLRRILEENKVPDKATIHVDYDRDIHIYWEDDSSDAPY